MAATAYQFKLETPVSLYFVCVFLVDFSPANTLVNNLIIVIEFRVAFRKAQRNVFLKLQLRSILSVFKRLV